MLPSCDICLALIEMRKAVRLMITDQNNICLNEIQFVHRLNFFNNFFFKYCQYIWRQYLKISMVFLPLSERIDSEYSAKEKKLKFWIWFRNGKHYLDNNFYHHRSQISRNFYLKFSMKLLLIHLFNIKLSDFRSQPKRQAE